MASRSDDRILIEVIYKADYCLPCHFMDEAVREILPKYADRVEYRRVEFLKGNGRERFFELSCTLFGEEAVRRHCRLAPVPSLFIDGELAAETIPPRFELEAAIEEALSYKQDKEGAHRGKQRKG
jgi:hypothetical protein